MRKLMYYAIGFALGILYLAHPYGSTIALFFMPALGIFGHFMKGRWQKPLVFLVSGFLFGLAYFSFYQYFFYDSLEEYQGEVTEISVEVLDFPQWGSYSYSIMVEVDLGMKKAKTLLYMDKEAGVLVPGDRFTAMATLYTGEERFDGESTTYYTAKGIVLRGVVEGDIVIEAREGHMLRHLPAYLAAWLKEGILETFPMRYAGLIQALVTGNRENLSPDLSSALSRTGLSHTVAVSGMHLAFLAGLLRLCLPSGRRFTAGAIIVIMVLFMLVSGSTPSVMRATVMIVLLHLAPLFGRERDDATALATAIFLILLANPYAVNHVGLHLSVLSVAGILCFVEKIQEKLSSYVKYDWEFAKFSPFKFIISSFSATMSAMVFTTPLVAVYFGSISVIAPLSNLLTLWAVSIAFAVGLLTGILGIFSTAFASFFSLPLIPILEYMLWVIPKLSSHPLAAVGMDSFYYGSALVFIYVLLGISYFVKGEKELRYPLCSGVFAFLLAFILHRASYLQGEFSFQVFDVGQGQSVLFSVGDTLIVSDCGGSSYENVGDMIGDSVQSLGKNKLDLLVLSHCHADHANGVVQLMERIWVEEIAMPPPDPEDDIQMEILEKALGYGTEVRFIYEETEIPLGEGREIRLYPPLGAGDSNEEGITFLLTVGETDVLITGDMGADIEEVLVETFDLPDVEVFLVGHHGSKFSSSEIFLDEIQGEIGIISVGGDNNYGHPTAEVLWKLYNRDITVYRTDLHGNMWFRAVG